MPGFACREHAQAIFATSRLSDLSAMLRPGQMRLHGEASVHVKADVLQTIVRALFW